METLVLPPQDKFSHRSETQNRRISVAHQNRINSEIPRRNSEAAVPSSFKVQVFTEKTSQNKFSPVDLSYGILPPPGNNMQFPHVNALQFMHGSNLHFPSANNFQSCLGIVNGVQAPPPVNGLQNKPSWSFSSYSAECDTSKNPGLLALPQHSLFPYHNTPTSTSPSSLLYHHFHPQMSPKMSPMFPSFSGCNSLDTALPAPRWHSMPESFSPPPFPIISAGNEIPKVEESAPLLRSRSESIRCSRSPENGVLSEWHPQFRSLKQVSLEKGNATKGNENKLEDYKRSRPQQAGQKVDGDVDQKTLKNIFEWKVVDSGSQKAQHGTGLGSGKQKFATSHRKTNEKKNIFKKAVSVMKDGGKNNNARVDNSSEAKGITLLKRTPKAEVAAKNPSKVSGESPIASNTDAYDCPKDVDEVDLDNSESDSLDISYGKSTTISRHDGASSLQRAEGNNFGDFSNCTGKGHSNAYLESKARDHINGMHSDCDMEERILFTPDYGGWKEESGLELASTLPDLNDRNHLPKGSNEALRVGCEVKSNEPGAVEIPLNPEDSSKGLFLEATGALSLDDIGKKVCAVSQCLHMTENWAGPAYSNSPPPSSLPLPKFSMRQMRSVSLELLPSNNDEFGEAGTAATIAGSHSAPPSPIRDAPEYSPPRAKMQGFSLDVASATKNLRRMLNLDFDA